MRFIIFNKFLLIKFYRKNNYHQFSMPTTSQFMKAALSLLLVSKFGIYEWKLTKKKGFHDFSDI